MLRLTRLSSGSTTCDKELNPASRNSAVENPNSTAQRQRREKKFPCPQCGELFTDSYKVRVHVGNHHDGEKVVYVRKPKPVQCPECGKTCHSKYTLKAHLRTHTGEKPFVCPHCHQRFSQSCTVHEHVRTVHFKIRRERKAKRMSQWTCEMCGKVYPDKWKMRQHQRTHAKSPCRCEWCGKTFPGAKSLQTHLTQMHRELHKSSDVTQALLEPGSIAQDNSNQVSSNNLSKSSDASIETGSMHQDYPNEETSCNPPQDFVTYETQDSQDEKLVCPVCQDLLSTIDELQTHVDATHPGSEIFSALDSKGVKVLCMNVYDNSVVPNQQL